jgi:hypothetical protein
MKRTFRIALVVVLGLAFGGAVSLESPPPAIAVSTTAAATAVAATPGDAYNLSPTSRTLAPTTVYGTSGSVSNPTNVLSHQSTRLNGNSSAVTLDFGNEVGGIVTLNFSGASGAGSWTMPTDKLRGGFRYLTLFLNSGGWVDVNGVSLDFTAAPGASNPAAYPDYFYSNDDVLNRIWYAGAYTVQLNTIDPTQGRVYPPVSSGWENNATVGVGSEVLVDGAKRDRSVWPA